MKFIENKFDIGQTVYLKTEKDQQPRMVTKITITTNGILYTVVMGTSESWHYDIEISDKKNVLLAVT